ncbi:MAG: AAA family ATPase [Nitrospinae bacterium]|nr:AAA family ATPase [Nitrospinota bacterium]
MIRNIKLKFGRATGVPAESIQTTPITVFVGPNNSGKSKILEELNQYCMSGQRNTTNVIIDQIEFESFSETLSAQKVDHVTLKPNPSEVLPPEHIIVGKKGHRQQINRQQLINALINSNASAPQFCQWYLSYNTLILNGQNRINLINSQNAGDLQQPPQTSFQVLFKDNAKRSEVRRIIFDAFGIYFVIDPTSLGRFRLRLASRPPSTKMEECGIHEEAIKYHKDALLIDQASDGVKAFTGMIMEIIAGDPAVLLIDEPEAFLHPSLSFKLGKEIALASLGSEKRLFVSTHSSNFVMGCIQSGAPVNIVRLTYRDNIATARILPSPDLLRLMRNPLLRSTGVMAGLFYEFVVVTESDTDRAFYQEINERLLLFKPEFGIPNCLFLNAQNKQTVRTIIKPLRDLGIPAAGIVDIDILKEGGSVWTDFLKSGFIPELDWHSLATSRSAINKKFKSSGKDMKKDGGINLLKTNDQEAGNNLFDRLSEYGLFAVRKGELESWLPDLNCTGHGPIWLIEAFEKMGEDPDDKNYLHPDIDDVWAFIGGIKSWLTNANRKGIPS